MENVIFWMVATVAACTVGLSKGGLPVISMTSVPMLSLVMPPTQAAGMLLPIYIVSDWFGLWAYRRAFSKKILWILAPAATAGVALGWATANLLSDRMVGGVIGALGAAFALHQLLRRRQNTRPREPKLLPGLFWGTAAGFTSFVSHAGSPPYQIYTLPLQLPKAVFAGTSTILFAWVNLIKLPAYWSLGALSSGHFAGSLWLFIPASLSVFAGVRLVRMLPDATFFKLVLYALLALSLRLLWVAIRG